MRTASIVVALAVVLAVLGFLFQDSLFTSEERLAEDPASATQAVTKPTAVETPSVESQAKAYITKLTETQAEPVPAKNADHFVSKDQIISLLPESTIEFTTPKDLARNPALKPDTPITIIRERQRAERTSIWRSRPPRCPRRLGRRNPSARSPQSGTGNRFSKSTRSW